MVDKKLRGSRVGLETVRGLVERVMRKSLVYSSYI